MSAGRPFFDGHKAPSSDLIQSDDLTWVFDYGGGSNLLYAGCVVAGTPTSGTGWQIRLFSYDGSNNLTGQSFANGSTGFDFIFDNRLSYSYS